jgi:hypothetical protein
MAYGDAKGDAIMAAQTREIAEAINQATIVSSYQIVTFDQTEVSSDGAVE